MTTGASANCGGSGAREGSDGYESAQACWLRSLVMVFLIDVISLHMFMQVFT